MCHTPPDMQICFRIQSEVTAIGRVYAPIKIKVYYPQTEEGMEALQHRVANVHSDMVNYTLQHLNCPTKQKQELLEAVISTVRERIREQAG